MPSFIKDLSLRRKSKSSFKTSELEIASNPSNDSSDQPPSRRNKSSSTLSSLFDKTPPTPLSQMSSTNLPYANGSSDAPSNTPPPVPGNRPRLSSSQGKRYSLAGASPNDSEARSPAPATSPWAPRVLSISDNSWVHQKVLLIFGQCADPQQPLDGNVTIFHHQDSFPAQMWPVNDGYFKALVYLQPGPNRLRLDLTSPRLPQSSGTHSSWLNINFLPLISAPPIQLCILVAKDSPEKYDAVPERIEREGNDLKQAIRKFRMSAYLWQAFTAEQMNRNSLGRRCFRYEEEWQPGSLTWKDVESGQMRNEAKIHVVRLDKTVAEIQDLDLAQQYQGAKRNGDLYGIASDAVKKHFNIQSGTHYISCMFLDSHWDKDVGTIRGHAALGGGDDTVRLAIFGSQALQSYPAHLEEVVPAFTDCTRTDTNFVANDCGESGSNWEAANIGIGAHLHETGHLLGCPHQENGVMLRDYVTFNRTFITREPYSTRTKQPGQRLVLPNDECTWMRLDTLRFRYHPTFQLPSDSVPNSDMSIKVWSVESGTLLVTAASGIAWIEMFPEGDGECHHWIEYSDHQPSAPNAPRQIMLTEQILRERLPEDKRKRKLRIDIFSCGGDRHEVSDVSALIGSSGQMKLPDGRPGFKSSKLGASSMDGTRSIETLFGTAWRNKEPILSVRVYHGLALDGLEFCYEGGRRELFGNNGGKPGGDEFLLDYRRGETILGFVVRCGLYIDGIQILTSIGRKSEHYGGTGGGAHTLIPPRGYSIAGIYGTCGSWLDGFGLIITR